MEELSSETLSEAQGAAGAGGVGGVAGAAAGGQNVLRGTDTQPARSPPRAQPRTSSRMNLPSGMRTVSHVAVWKIMYIMTIISYRNF